MTLRAAAINAIAGSMHTSQKTANDGVLALPGTSRSTYHNAPDLLRANSYLRQ